MYYIYIYNQYKFNLELRSKEREENTVSNYYIHIIYIQKIKIQKKCSHEKCCEQRLEIHGFHRSQQRE